MIRKKGRKMGDEEHHVKLAKEKRKGAEDELAKGRHTNVGDLALKAVEHAVEACASRDGLHFHTHPRSAHAERSRWLKKNFPELAKSFDEMWGIYMDLGYDGLNGERAEKAIKEMGRILGVLERESGIRFK